MPNSSSILQQIQGLIGEMNPLIDSAPQAPEFFRRGIGDAFNWGLPLLKEANNLEAGAYALPGQLMQDYVGSGADTMTKLNGILGRLGSQFALSDTASDLADRQGKNINALADSLTNQYGLMIQGMKDKYGMLSPLFSTLKGSEDNAAARASSERQAQLNRDAQKVPPLNFNPLPLPGVGGGYSAKGVNWVAANNSAPAGQVVNPKYANQSLNMSQLPSDYFINAASTPKLSTQYMSTPRITPTPQMSSPVRRY